MSAPENTGNISQFDRRQLLRGAAAVAAGAAAAGIVPAGAAHAGGGRRRHEADLVIQNGRVLVLDKRFRTGDAVAIRDGKVLGVGRVRDLRHFVGRHTEVLDAGGGTVLPGINDTHLHLGSWTNLPPYTLNVNTATIEDLVAIVRDAVAQAPSPDSWIRGRGWQEIVLPRPPLAADLDPVSGNHPVVLVDQSAHTTAVNSVALRLAGITRDTVPPAGGVIEKDANGEPTGVLRETAAALVRDLVPPFTDAEISQALDDGLRTTLSRGITSITQPGLGLDQLDVFAEKARAATFPLRTMIMLSVPRPSSSEIMRELLSEFRDPPGVDPRRMRVIGIKIGADGVPRGRTAWMHEPYLDGTNGSMTLAGATIDEQIANLHGIIRIAVDAGLQVATHACGDATTDTVVDGYVRAIRQNPRRRYLRHSVHHCNFPSARTLRTMARYDISANLNAEILYLQGRVLESIVGPELTEYQWPYRSALRAGVPVTSGSDGPAVVEGLWLNGVKAAVLREAANGSQAGSAERITVSQALATYTRTAAWLDRAEGWKGTLERGKVADICIVDGDLLRDDPRSFSQMQVSNTLVDGRVVYERSSSSPAGTAAATTAAAARTIGPAWDDSSQCCCEVADQFGLL